MRRACQVLLSCHSLLHQAVAIRESLKPAPFYPLVFSQLISTMGTKLAKGKKYDLEQCQATAPPEEISEEDFVEEVICTVDDIEDNSMKEMNFGDDKVLLVKEKGVITALGPNCTHYGLPLEKGVLCNGKIRCAFHGACFNSKTGDIEDFPGLDSLPKYEVTIDGEDVKVKAYQKHLKTNKRTKLMATHDTSDDITFVIIGGGPAALSCVETLRQECFTGKIVMLTQESTLPYDRPKLSKAMDIGLSEIILRDQDFFEKYNIEVMLEREVESVDFKKKAVKTADGEEHMYDRLLIASGSRPRPLDVPGNTLNNIFMLRTPEDANRIAEASAGKDVVILGLSFIGMEAAAFLVGKANSVTVVGTGTLPFEHVFGPEIAGRLKQLYEDKDVKFLTELSISEFNGEDDTLTEVTLTNGEKLPADVCLVGIGAVPNIDFAKGSKLNLNPKGYLTVSKHMRSSIEDVYAAGDVVAFPLFLINNEVVNISHWQMAHRQGHVAAKNMLGKKTEMESVPFFWTQLFDTSIRYTGFAKGIDEVLIDGALDELCFAAFIIKDGKVVAAASMNRDPIVSEFAEFLKQKKVLTASEIKSDPLAWREKLHK